MKYQWFYESYKKKLTEWLGAGVGTASPPPQTPQSPVSPFRVTISQSKVDQIKEVVKLLYRVAHSKPYIESIQTMSDFERDMQKKSLEGGCSDSSLLMSYDFHIDSKGQLKLIEVNTNSSGYLVSELVDQVQAEQTQRERTQGEQAQGDPIQREQAQRGQTQGEQAQRGRTQGAQSQREHTQTTTQEKMQTTTQATTGATVENKNKATKALLFLKQSFEEEWELFSKKSTVPERVWIVDHQIKKQKMYIEFLMYQSLLSSWGWPCELYEIGDLKIDSGGFLVNSEGEKAQMIYNRWTDFYFENFPDMRKAFLNKKCCISPHPIEYLLLANKLRLCEWSSVEFLNKLSLSVEEKAQIQSVVPWTAPVGSLSVEELWKKRKLLFLNLLRGMGVSLCIGVRIFQKKFLVGLLRRGGYFSGWCLRRIL